MRPLRWFAPKLQRQSREEAAHKYQRAAAATEAMHYEVLRLKSQMEAMRIDAHGALANAEAARMREARRAQQEGEAERRPDAMSTDSSQNTDANDGSSAGQTIPSPPRLMGARKAFSQQAASEVS